MICFFDIILKPMV